MLVKNKTYWVLCKGILKLTIGQTHYTLPRRAYPEWGLSTVTEKDLEIIIIPSSGRVCICVSVYIWVFEYVCVCMNSKCIHPFVAHRVPQHELFIDGTLLTSSFGDWEPNIKVPAYSAILILWCSLECLVFWSSIYFVFTQQKEQDKKATDGIYFSCECTASMSESPPSGLTP